MQITLSDRSINEKLAGSLALIAAKIPFSHYLPLIDDRAGFQLKSNYEFHR
jgi:hypothetical protein